MSDRDEIQFRIMTYNIGFGKKDFGMLLEDVIEVIKTVSPDILTIQEATEYQDADGLWHNSASEIAQALGFGENYFFGPTISMQKHMDVRRSMFLHGIFNDWGDWKQGNAIFSRWGFTRLSDPLKQGTPKNVAIYRPPVYEGTRDTEGRNALLGRITKSPIFPFIVCVHLTTLNGERGPEQLLGKSEEAQMLRFEQAKRLLHLLRQYVLEPGKIAFLSGDFNAMASEPCISSVLGKEGGFVRLESSGAEIRTHPKVPDAIDHILFYPASKLQAYKCWIVDSEIARRASDHLPVVADVVLK